MSSIEYQLALARRDDLLRQAAGECYAAGRLAGRRPRRRGRGLTRWVRFGHLMQLNRSLFGGV